MEVQNITGGITVKNAKNAFVLRGNDVNFPNSTCYVDTCGTFNAGAVLIEKSPLVKYLYITNSALNTNYGAIKVSETNSNPSIYNCTIEDAYYGIRIYKDADAILKYSILKNLLNHSICLYSDSPNQSATIDIAWAQTDVIPASGKYAIFNDEPVNSMSVNSTWWNRTGAPTDTTIFKYHTGYISYSPYAASAYGLGASKMVSREPNPFHKAMDYELANNYLKALDIYYDIIHNDDNIAHKRMAIKSIFRVNELNDLDFNTLRDTIQTELMNAESGYKATLDYLLCDIFVSEKKFDDAIAAFSLKANNYKDSSTEVNILARIAVIYGDLLRDKAKALEFADRAAAINPGQDNLASAYDAAGIKYNPNDHEDKFAVKNADKPSQPIDESDAEAIPGGTVTITPNPANPMTTINYSIVNPGNVKINIYSVSGQKVATLVDEFMTSGNHAVVFDGSNLASGVYFYQFQTEGFAKSGKMLLVK